MTPPAADTAPEDLVARLLRKLAQHPDLVYRATPTRVTVDAPDQAGFAVSLSVRRQAVMVAAAEGWHEHFDLADADEALNCFAWLLSNDCRLRTAYRGKRPVRWVAESRDAAGRWVAASETGLLSLDFWSRRRSTYRQNGPRSHAGG